MWLGGAGWFSGLIRGLAAAKGDGPYPVSGSLRSVARHLAVQDLLDGEGADRREDLLCESGFAGRLEDGVAIGVKDRLLQLRLEAGVLCEVPMKTSALLLDRQGPTSTAPIGLELPFEQACK